MDLAGRVDRSLIILALVAPTFYLLLESAKPYPGDVVLKSSMCLFLAALAWRHGKRLLVAALLFSAIGDALLAIDGTKLFVPALGSFLATHLLYSAIFLISPKLQFARLTWWRLVLLCVVPSFALVYAVLLWPKLDSLALPVALYISAIVAMTMLSLRIPGVLVQVGAMCFLISDSLISLDKFLWQASWIGPSIWISYAAAQFSIARGLVGSAYLSLRAPTKR